MEAKTKTENRTTGAAKPHDGSGKLWPFIGRVCESRGVSEWLDKDGRRKGFARRAWRKYVYGDWGEVDGADKRANNLALFNGSRILAAYRFQGRKVWIITDAENDNREREYTMILFPSEY